MTLSNWCDSAPFAWFHTIEHSHLWTGQLQSLVLNDSSSKGFVAELVSVQNSYAQSSASKGPRVLNTPTQTDDASFCKIINIDLLFL